MTGSGNVVCDNGIDDGGIGETTGMAGRAILLAILVLTTAVLEKLLEFGIYNGSTSIAIRAANFRHCKDLAFVLVIILQVITILLIVMCCFFYMKELLALFGLILIHKKQSILPLHAM